MDIQPRQYVQRVRVNRVTGEVISVPEVKTPEPTVIERIKEVFVTKPVSVVKEVQVPVQVPIYVDKEVLDKKKLGLGFAAGAVAGEFLQRLIGWLI